MGIFGELSGSKEVALGKQAADLVAAAQINATTMFVRLLDRFPVLREADVKRWDFILTVAGVFIATSRLNSLGLSDAQRESLTDAVAQALAKWDPNGIRAFFDCKTLFESEYDRLAVAGHDPKLVASDALGIWIVWNVLDRAPKTEDECKLVRVTGAMVTHAFFDWWEE